MQIPLVDLKAQLGHLACFSFYPGKNLGAYGDGGAVTGNDENLLAKVRKLRDRGRSSRYEHQEVGYGEREEVPNVRHAYHLYVVRTPRRDALLARLKACGIGAGIHYPLPLHRQPAYLKLGYADVVLPETERAAAEVLSLPMYPELTEEQIGYVTEQIREFFR